MPLPILLGGDMIQFDTLEFLNGNTVRLDAQVSDLSYYADVYIDSIIIDTDLTAGENGPSSNPVYTETIEGDEKSVSRTFDLDTILGKDRGQRMLFVFIKAKGIPAADTPCGMDNEYSVKAVADLSGVYDKAVSLLKCVKGCGCIEDECVVSAKLANFALEWFQLKSSIELGKNTRALESFCRLVGYTKNKGREVYSVKRCGCHDA